MTLSEMGQSGYSQTEKEIKQFYTKVAQEYKTSLDAIRKDLRDLYDKIMGDMSPAEVAKLLKEQPAAFYAASTKFDRLTGLQKKVQTEFIKASIAAGNTTVEASKLAITNNYYAQQFGVSFASPVNLSFTVLNPAVIEISVLGTPKVYQGIVKSVKEHAEDKFGDLLKYQPQHGSLTETILNARKAQLAKIQSSITQGLIQGKSYTQTAKDVKKVMDNTASQALRIVRTESARNMNAGAYASHMQAKNQGLDLKRQILSVLDDRTRQQSQQVDTDIEDDEGYFHYPGGVLVTFPGNSGVARFDINDRETTIEIIEGESPDERIGRNPLSGVNETMTFKDYPSWMESKGFTQNKTGRWTAKT